MGDSAGSGNGMRKRAISRQPESLPLFFAPNPAEPVPEFTAASELTPGSVSSPREESFSTAAFIEAPMLSSVQQTGKPASQRIPRWLERAELILRVLLRMYIGLAICYAPWSHIFWDQNPLFVQFPTLSVLAANGAVRGIVSGLGLLNLWIALQDVLHHGENKR